MLEKLLCFTHIKKKKPKQTEKPQVTCITFPKSSPVEPEMRTEALLFT